MSETGCGYPQRDEVLVAYVYGEIEPEGHVRFTVHLESCAACRQELAAFHGVRASLASWSPPAFVSRRQPRAAWWKAIPVWAQVAAAMLCVGVAAGLANLDIRWTREGLAVRTGWSPQPVAGSREGGDTRAAAPTAAPVAVAAPWRAEIAALEQRLRAELRTAGASSPAQPAADAESMHRVRRLLEESERRQQRELALRVADVMRDVESQRRADLVKIDRHLGLMQNNAGVEVLKQRELLNYLVRASQSK